MIRPYLWSVVAMVPFAAGPAVGGTTNPQTAAAARAGGCPVPDGALDQMDLQPWPGTRHAIGGPDPGAGEMVVATLSGDATGKTLGDLCVALVRVPATQAGPIQRLAGLRDSTPLNPPSEVDPVTTVGIAIDTVPYRFAPGEVAVGVRAGGGFHSTSTNAVWTTLYLLRRQGSVLSPIFEAETQTVDGGPERKLRFAATITRGAYDLLLGRRRYVWNGSHYVAMRR